MDVTKLSKDARAILECLPKEPLTAAVPDLATDLFDRADSIGRQRVQRGLSRLRPVLFERFENTAPYGRKRTFGIRSGAWDEVQADLATHSELACR